MDSRLLTVDEVVDVLKIGRTKVYDLIKSNTIRSVKIGRSRRIPQSALKEFIETCV